MSAHRSKKKNSLLVLLVLLLVGAIALLSKADKQTSAVPNTTEAAEQKSEVEAVREWTADVAVAEQKVEEPHSVNCAHCVSGSAEETHAKNESKPPVLQTQPNLDPIFKRIHRERISFSRADFDFLKGSQLGQKVDFELAGREFSGEVAIVREGKRTEAYAITFPEGNLKVTINTLGEFKAHFMFNGDSRVVEIGESKIISDDIADEGHLVASEVSVSDVFCAPKGTVYPLSAPQPVAAVSGLAEEGAKEFAQSSEPVAALVLTSESSSGHVLYLNFDGETVTGDPWNIEAGISTINALPSPRANDDEYVTNLWERVVEDFAPFNITVTTDRAVYDATDSEKRLQAIITPTNLVFPGAGGVAYLNSYASDYSDIVWVWNLSEYACASTISHEAGHAFGLVHDGPGPVGAEQYYPGHNSSYAPGWGPIMGAPFIGINEEVDQWSKGEYDGAINLGVTGFQDDVAIIANTANGFGYKADDYADIYTGTGGLDVGILDTTGPDQVGGAGIISKSTDKDVFRFAAAFSGLVSMTVNPIDVESTDDNTSGANLAASTRLLDSAGNEIAVGVDVGDVLLSSKVEASIAPGIYYLEVDGAGRGADPSGGFSDYASLGQYEIVGDLPTQPLSVDGSPPEGKQDVTVLIGDETTSLANGTDFGYSYPSNGPITHTFILSNNGITDLENVSVSLANGIDFEIVSPPVATIPPGALVSMSIAYDPLESGANGIDDDTVIINYETIETISFEFAISGLSTQSATKDNYEDNNVFNQATNLNAVEDVWLSDYRGKAFFISYPVDFYTFNAQNGDLVTVDVSYDATEGPITFELINSQNVLLGSTTAEDGKILFLVPENYTSLHKPLYIRASITGDSSVRSPYDLRWSRVTSDGLDDFYEENDTQAEAFDLTGASNPRLSEYLGKAILNDVDWYKIEIPRDPFLRIFYVRAEFVHAEGDIDIEIFAENEGGFGYEYGLTDQDEDYEVLTYFQNVSMPDYAEEFTPSTNQNIMGLEPGTYYVKVSGDFAGNEYDLVVEPKRDDNYEIADAISETENDLIENPTDLGEAIVGKWLSEIDGIGVSAGYGPGSTQEKFVNILDSDWYRFSLPSGLTVGELLLDYDSIIAETRAFRIYDADGTLLAESSDGGDGTTTSNDLGVISVSNPVGSEFLIQAAPDSTVGGLAPYDFRVTVNERPPELENLVDDNYEENDNFTELYDLSGNAGFWLTAVDGYGVNLDPDWYQITVPENAARLEIKCAYDGTLGNMELYLSRKDGPTLFRAPYPAPEPPEEPEDPDAPEPEPEIINTKSIVWEDPEPGQYAVTIIGDRQGNSYNMFWGYDLLEDAYEENDVRAEATDLTGHEKQLLNKLNGPGVQADEDWYRVTARADTDELRIISTFTDAEGDIDMELYNSAGFLVARATSVTDDETITLRSPAAGDYFVRIYYDNASNQYDLWWGAFTQEELDAVEADAYEVDNSFGAATELRPRTSLQDLSGLATQTDEDWWSINTSERNSGFLIDCTFTHAEGDIDFEVIDSYGAVIVRADSQSDNESVSFNAPVPGATYYIRVYGANLGNAYDLYWVDYREDAFEENDSFETASDITDLRQHRLSETDVPTQGDDDWYLVTAEQINSILVLELTYTDADGSIFYEVYDSNKTRLTSDLTNDEVKYLQYTLPTSGQFYIRVFGDDAYNNYDLFWNALPEDAFEENDIQDDAHDISSDASVDLEGVIFDDDWFVLDPPYGVVTVELTLSYDATFGQTDLSVFNQFGEPVFVFPSETNINAVAFEVDPFDGVTYIQLTGADGNYGNPYTLNWVPVTRDIDEDNDTLATATDLRGLDGIPLSESGGYDTSADEDWFLIDPSGSNLNIYCRFEHAAGDIDIELYDEAGKFLLRSVSDTDDELISSPIVPGNYYIRVFGETAGNPYDLVWTSYDSDDGYEENDSALEAADLLPVEYQLQENLVQLDDDWYGIEVEAGDSLLIAEINAFAKVDAMVLELYDAGGVLVDSVATAEGDTLIEANSLVAGTYYLLVSGKNLGGRYALIWSSGSEDNYEENDADLDARDLSANPATQISAIDGFGAQYDEDWFLVTLTSDDSNFFAQLDFVHNEGDLSLALLDDTGAELALSDDATDTESFTVNGLGAGDYYLRVLGPNIGSVYDLVWSAYAEDNYENNDTFVQSYDIGSSVSGILSPIDGLGVRGSDDDYFSLSVPTGYVTLDVTCTFTHADGDIALEVFDGGESSLESSDTGDDDESVSVSVDPNGDTIYILVSGAEGTGATYDLTWTFGSEDLYEDNDTDITATDITAQEDTLLSDLSGYATQSDSDFYLVTLPENSRVLNVDVFFSHSLGDIAVNIYDSGPTLIATADSATDNETISLLLPDLLGGDYLIEVTGAGSGNFYDLLWSVAVDDPYEENDDATTPYDLSAGNGVRLSEGLGLGIQYDEDWFSLTTPVGDVSLNVLIDEFSVLDGDINLELYDAAGNLLAASTEGTFSEEIQVPLDPAGESFKVRVYGDNNGNSYDLIWSTSVADLYEENDFVEDYYDLTDAEGVWLRDVNGLATQADDDWYQIVVSTGATMLTINCDFIHADGDIDMELYRLDPTAEGEKTVPGMDQRKPTLVRRVISEDDDEVIIFDDSDPEFAPGIYFIRVYFGNQGNVYDLYWEDALVDPAGDSDFLDEEWFFSDNGSTLVDSRLLTPLANVDGDNFPNWAEYALDLDVGVADTVVIDNSKQVINGKTYFTISFIRNAEAVARHYQFYVDESSDLSFEGSHPAIFDSMESLGDGLERVTYRCTKDMSESKRCFFRIRVEAPEKF